MLKNFAESEPPLIAKNPEVSFFGDQNLSTALRRSFQSCSRRLPRAQRVVNSFRLSVATLIVCNTCIASQKVSFYRDKFHRKADFISIALRDDISEIRGLTILVPKGELPQGPAPKNLRTNLRASFPLIDLPRLIGKVER